MFLKVKWRIIANFWDKTDIPVQKYQIGILLSYRRTMKLTSRTKKLVFVLGGFLVGILVVVALWPSAIRAAARPYRTIVSPDGKYTLVVYRLPQFRMAFPGQAGDAPGYVRLFDQSGKVLEEKDIEMVENIDQVEWEKTTVHIKLFADWRLPQ